MPKNVRSGGGKATPAGKVGKPARLAPKAAVTRAAAPPKPSKSNKPAPAKAAKVVAKPAKPVARAETPKASKPETRLPDVKRSSISAPARRMDDPISVRRAEPASPNGGADATAPRRSAPAKSMKKSKVTDLADIVLPDGYRPSDAEPFMGPKHRAYFKRKLATWKDDIVRETMETLQVLHDDTAQHPDIADRAASESDRALELRARDRQRKLISKIDSALKRIEDGSYGYCLETGEPIGLRRLDARPIATLSLEAQERHERRERVYRDD